MHDPRAVCGLTHANHGGFVSVFDDMKPQVAFGAQERDGWAARLPQNGFQNPIFANITAKSLSSKPGLLLILSCFAVEDIQK
jgi:hypothetical protein